LKTPGFFMTGRLAGKAFSGLRQQDYSLYFRFFVLGLSDVLPADYIYPGIPRSNSCHDLY